MDKKINKMGGKDSGSAQVIKTETKPKGFFSRGERHYEREEYQEAIASFDSYRKRIPKGRRYAQATLKMGRCFEKLKMKNDAKAFYKEVIQRYPKTAVALKAEANLQKL